MTAVRRPFTRFTLLVSFVTFGLLAVGMASATAAPGGRTALASASAAGLPPGPPGAFNFGSAQPATASLNGVSCLKASFCMAVGSYLTPAGTVRTLAEKFNGRTWQVLGSGSLGSLSSVSCVSSSLCMAVGSGSAQKWNGHRWAMVRGAAGAGLSGVSCVSRSFCMAVGTGRGGEGNLSSAWNGRSWRSLRTPDTGCVPFCGLTRVSCPRATACVAVGSAMNDAGDLVLGTAVIWNGRAWRVNNPPSPGDDAVLPGVSCTSGTKCMAVGGFTVEVPPCHCPLAVRWNGSGWQQVTAPAITGSMSSVSCPLAGNCVAVGGDLALAWNGSTWKQLTIVSPGETGTSLGDVSCWHASACMAVGDYTTSTGAQLALAEQWNGSSWQVRRTPTPGDQFTGLSAVSCPVASSCVAVGSYINGSDVQSALAQQWNGRTWRVLATPSPGAQSTTLTAIACAAANACMAVGYFDSAGAHQAFAQRWNGSSWQVLTIPHSGILTAVACPAVTSCTAVGSFISGGDRLALAAGWNGSAWQVQSAQNPAGSNFSQLAGVSCSSGTSCIAVGGADSGVASPVHPLAETWNGATWQLLAVPGTAPAELRAIACRIPRNCMAVGSFLNAHGRPTPSGTLAETWNGTTWQVRPTPSSAFRPRAHLAAVSCTTPSRCMAVGGYVRGSGSAFALAESWNGHHWRLLRAQSPGPGFSDLYGVSCMRGFRCIAVGGTGAQLTLAEKWTGARWVLLRSRNP